MGLKQRGIPPLCNASIITYALLRFSSLVPFSKPLQILQENRRKPTGNEPLPEHVARAKKIDRELHNISSVRDLVDGVEPILGAIGPPPTVRAIKVTNPPLQPTTSAIPSGSCQPKSKGEELISTVTSLASQIQEWAGGSSVNSTVLMLMSWNQDIQSQLDWSQMENRRLERKVEKLQRKLDLDKLTAQLNPLALPMQELTSQMASLSTNEIITRPHSTDTPSSWSASPFPEPGPDYHYDAQGDYLHDGHGNCHYDMEEQYPGRSGTQPDGGISSTYSELSQAFASGF